MRYLPESAEHGDDSMPVTGVTWHEANEFCTRLSKLDGRTYALPTEAQWEYACRAGAQTAFAGSDSPNQLGWFLGAATNGGLHTGRLKQPNHWNLFDFHGNAAEWCDDRYVPVYPPIPDDPYVGGDFSQPRVVRGGSFNTIPSQGRSAARDKLDTYKSKPDLGFRVVVKNPPPGLAAPH
jgi:formylglycine-generating enzyme required for sulfatase activity